METRQDRTAKRLKRRLRYRQKVVGTAQKPRVTVFRSLKHIYVQAIDDGSGATLASASTLDTEVKGKVGSGGNVTAAKVVGETLAERLKKAGVETVKFDRGGYLYHGRVKAVADGARGQGLKF